ncbi:hypothetical protein [Dyella humicola]|uniref:hypothetical protein n=1 Tax=Dyella humicola TaxID=2992126 RepID=UPI0022599C1D|nr:hypothetical protein [Dyella humicola]
MRKVDLVLSAFILVAVVMGVAAYRAWFPAQVSGSALVGVDNLPDLPPVPMGLYSIEAGTDVAAFDGANAVCRDGLMIWNGPRGPQGTTIGGQIVRCLMPVHRLVQPRATG